MTVPDAMAVQQYLSMHDLCSNAVTPLLGKQLIHLCWKGLLPMYATAWQC